VLVEMIMTDETWYVVRNTPGVTGFVGTGNKPIPLKEEEATQILRYMGMDELRIRIEFELGEWVRITSGPFQGLDASIQDINDDKGKVKVMASMFGRETLVELDFGQVQKLD
jgi:transcriptional antiterminator NusG